MTEALTFACVLLVGALLGAALTGWLVGRVVFDVGRFGEFMSGYLQQYSRALGHHVLSTADDEGRLVFIPIDQLARSLETQLPLWTHPPALPPDRIRFEPPEGSH